ncbi:hypothetical protein ACT7CZ_31405 [Bacillus cereus]
MKEWVKVTLSIAGGIVLLACAGGYYVGKITFQSLNPVPGKKNGV